MGHEWKLTLIERLVYWTSYAFHMYKSRHQICNECMGSRRHTKSLVSKNVGDGNQPAADPAYQTLTLHFLNLHLWHALTTRLLTSTVTSDPSDFGERGMVGLEAMFWARPCEESKDGLNVGKRVLYPREY